MSRSVFLIVRGWISFISSWSGKTTLLFLPGALGLGIYFLILWYEKTPGIDDYSESESTYEYNESGYTVKVKDGEEYIYD
jgi:hypothetical protein